MDELAVNSDDGGGSRSPTASSVVAVTGTWEQRLGEFRARHAERSLTIGGQVWPYLLGGQGERVALLLHGSAGDGESLFGLMGPMERDYCVISPTYPDGVYTIASVVDGLVGLLKVLGMAPALVVGYSLGGYLAQALAWRYPELISGMALLNTGGPAQGAARTEALQNLMLSIAPGGVVRAAVRAGAAALLSLESPGLDRDATVFWRGYFAEMSARVGKRRILSHGRLVVDFLRGPVDVEFVSEEWPSPTTLIVSSACDRIIEPIERRALETLYPRAARVMEPNAGHLTVLTQPERYLATIEAAFPSAHVSG
jgi:pimeloyl-ACP methyl ester carboxylesterase